MSRPPFLNARAGDALPVEPSIELELAALAWCLADALGFITLLGLAPFLLWWVFAAPAETYVDPSLLVSR